jgi:hypothetical protein
MELTLNTFQLTLMQCGGVEFQDASEHFENRTRPTDDSKSKYRQSRSFGFLTCLFAGIVVGMSSEDARRRMERALQANADRPLFTTAAVRVLLSPAWMGLMY